MTLFLCEGGFSPKVIGKEAMGLPIKHTISDITLVTSAKIKKIQMSEIFEIDFSTMHQPNGHLRTKEEG